MQTPETTGGSKYEAPTGSAAPQTTSGTSTDTATGAEFKAVQGGAESTSGAVLLIEAYAAIWLVAMIFVLMSWLKQRQILARVESLELAVAAARKAIPFGVGGDDPKGGDAPKGSADDEEAD